jgi:catechol 2,3-dioxygenase-like lactoylglutathione lyase family enzyme
VVQFTPPGSGCSVIFGKNVTLAAPGSAQGLHLIVSDIVAARDELRARGVEVSEVFRSDGEYAGTDEAYLFGRRRTSGPDPERGSYRSFASFRDPDGNGWLFQEVTTRLAGRIDSGVTSFSSANDLADAFRGAEAATVSTRPGSARVGMRTGQSGTPSTWSRSRQARNCRLDYPRRERHRRRVGRSLRDLASRRRRC